jgi:hypothetical protein
MSNKVITALAITNAVASADGADQENTSCRGGHFAVKITSITGTNPTATFTIQGKDPVGGGYYTILASAALTTAATTVYKVYPGLTAAANVTVSDILPRVWRVIVVTGGDAVTDLDCTVTASLVV